MIDNSTNISYGTVPLFFEKKIYLLRFMKKFKNIILQYTMIFSKTVFAKICA
jgi:hypothetical protein